MVFVFSPDIKLAKDPVEDLDVSYLSNKIIDPILGIVDQEKMIE